MSLSVLALASQMVASFYWQGTHTASGERFDPEGMTAAHKTLPLNTRLRVCLDACVTVRINDRGPFIAGRDLDLARGAARVIGLDRLGVALVQVSTP